MQNFYSGKLPLTFKKLSIQKVVVLEASKEEVPDSEGMRDEKKYL